MQERSQSGEAGGEEMGRSLENQVRGSRKAWGSQDAGLQQGRESGTAWCRRRPPPTVPAPGAAAPIVIGCGECDPPRKGANGSRQFQACQGRDFRPKLGESASLPGAGKPAGERASVPNRWGRRKQTGGRPTSRCLRPPIAYL